MSGWPHLSVQFLPCVLRDLCGSILIFFLGCSVTACGGPSPFDAALLAFEVESVPVANLTTVNWPGDDYAPFISPHGRLLIFQSDRPGTHEGPNFWYSVNRNAADRTGPPNWTVPLPLVFPLPDTALDLEPVREASMKSEGKGDETGPARKEMNSFTVNADGFEGHPSLVFRAGMPVELYFTGMQKDASGRPGYDNLNIYFTRLRDGRWSPPEHLNVVNSDWNDRMPSISADGRTLYFVSDRPGGFGGSDVWMSTRDLKTGRWSAPINAGPSVNTEYNEITPHVSKDGSMLFFSSDRPGGRGQFDIYVCRHRGAGFDAAENLGLPFNSSRDDEALTLTEDGIWAVFASDRLDLSAKGGYDLYRVSVPERLRFAVEVLFTGAVQDGSARRPLGVDATISIYSESGPRIETSDRFEKDPGITERNNFAVRLYSGREYRVVASAPGFHPQEFFLDYKGNVPAGKVDRRDIVLQPVKPGEDVNVPGESRLVAGIVLDDATGLSLPGTKVEMTARNAAPALITLDRDAHFSIKAEDKLEFELSATAPGYVPLRRRFVATPDLKQIVLRLRPAGGADACPGDDPSCVDNMKIYFGVDTAAVEPKEMAKVEAVVRLLKADPSMKVEIQGHTDGTATAEYNQQLSEKRAQAVQTALKAAGIGPERMVVRGYGFGRRVISPDQDPKSRALNRRVEFRRLAR